MLYYCFLGIHESSISLPENSKLTKLPQNAVPRPEPFALQAQLAEHCQSVFSLFFDVFNLRAGVKAVTMRFCVSYSLFPVLCFIFLVLCKLKL
jgi:hypothetical protein